MVWYRIIYKERPKYLTREQKECISGVASILQTQKLRKSGKTKP